jgi:dihydropteroate synthase
LEEKRALGRAHGDLTPGRPVMYNKKALLPPLFSLLATKRVLVMGVLNVTPDSFYDGGRYLGVGSAVGRGLCLWEEGADIVDVGGESTRPGSDSVPEEVELERVLPVIRGLVKSGVRVSVDTRKPKVAERALEEGAQMVNDVSGFRDPQMREVVVRAGCEVCVMHMRGEPKTMQENPEYRDVVEEVGSFLREQAEWLVREGLPKERIWIDPGIGFGKTVEHNVELLRHLERLVGMGFGVMVGVSRKSFIGRIAGVESPGDRLPGSLGAMLFAVAKGAKMVRVHDVKETVQALRVWGALSGH